MCRTNARRRPALLACVLCVTCTATPSPRTADPATRVHSHNDYLQPRPLTTALQNGLGSAEADVFLDDGELRVGHERWQLRPGRTLTALYLDPLREFAREHGGRVRADGAPFVLLVDIKAQGDAVYAVLREELARYDTLLTRFEGERVLPGAVTVILSGDRPWRTVAADPQRLCAIDGRPKDLDRDLPSSLVPWISDSWKNHLWWNGYDTIPADDREVITQFVARCREQGKELRFWGAPDVPDAWRTLLELGVHRIGTDRPATAAAALRAALE